MRVLLITYGTAIFSAFDIAASTIKRRQFCPLTDSVCAITDLTSPPPPSASVSALPPPPPPLLLNNDTSSISKNATISSINSTQILVNGTIPIPDIPPGIPQNATAIRNDGAAYRDADLHHSIVCPPHVRPIVQAMIHDAALLATAGAAAAKAGGFPFNFFFPDSYNATAHEILLRAADALSNRGEPTLFSCHDWAGNCDEPGVNAWAGQRQYHIPDNTGATNGYDQLVNVVTLCRKVIGWPFNNWPCSKPPVHYDTPAHVILHETLHFRNVTLGEHIRDVVYGSDACHALLVNAGNNGGNNGGGGGGANMQGLGGLPGPEKSADCLASFASYAWELGFGYDEGKNGWRGEACPDKWGPPLVYPARITIGERP